MSPFSALASQFGRPRGALGRLAGAIMAVENKRANAVVVDALELRPTDYVLEIGPGPGVALALAAERAAFTVGVDLSPEMVSQAARRCRDAIDAQRAEVRLAEAADLPFDDDTFSCAFTVHTLHHWPCLKAGLRELRRVVEPGGRVVLANRMQRRGRDPHAHGATPAELVSFAALLAELGFEHVERTDHDLGRETLAVFSAVA